MANRGHRISDQGVRRLRRMSRQVGNYHPRNTHGRRSKYPVGGGGKPIAAFRIDARLFYGLEVDGFKARWNPDTELFENDANAKPIRAELTRDYYFDGMVVSAQKFGSIWQVISPGFSPIVCVLDGDLASESTATASVWHDGLDTGDNITVSPWSGTLNETITSGTQILASQRGDGLWHAIIEECPSA